ncbi:MAG: hypothetical protein GWP91_14185 [Rhodobacterales bacterium]|nr:hypothetical protein [Rhodobacterales bacterium]
MTTEKMVLNSAIRQHTLDQYLRTAFNDFTQWPFTISASLRRKHLYGEATLEDDMAPTNANAALKLMEAVVTELQKNVPDGLLATAKLKAQHDHVGLPLVHSGGVVPRPPSAFGHSVGQTTAVARRNRQRHRGTGVGPTRALRGTSRGHHRRQKCHRDRSQRRAQASVHRLAAPRPQHRRRPAVATMAR